MALPSFLAVGHVTKDLGDGGFGVGGGVTYAALAARGLGYGAAVLTRAGADVAAALGVALAGVEVLCLPSAATTTFRNAYQAGRRVQYLVAVGAPIRAADVPPAWCEAPLVLLAPVAGELADGLWELFPRSLLGLSAQGWLRGRAADGRVYPAPWPGAAAALARADVVVFSEEDVGEDWQVVRDCAAQTRLLALTQGPRGATLFVDGVASHVPAFPAREVDPTGAGDVFAAAFLVAYQETRDPLAAARFASCAASFVVTQPGTAGIPSRAAVAARLRDGPGAPEPGRERRWTARS